MVALSFCSVLQAANANPKNTYSIALVAAAAKPHAPNEGALYLELETPGWKQVKVHLYQPSTQKTFVFTQNVTDNTHAVQALWLIPEGKYTLIRIATQDDDKGEKKWMAKQTGGKPFVVERDTISNLGTWSLSALNKSSNLNANFLMQPTGLEIEELQKKGFRKGVINGFSGLMQTVSKYRSALGGVTEKAKGEESKTALAAYRFSRSLILSYNANLFRHNDAHRESFNQTLQLYDNNWRQCYKLGLANRPDLAGTVMFSFLVESGRLSNVSAQQDKLRDASVISCLSEELAALSVPMNKNMMGVIHFSFNFKDRKL